MRLVVDTIATMAPSGDQPGGGRVADAVGAACAGDQGDPAVKPVNVVCHVR